MLKKGKLKGFTLAEVLITLTIIGVISALTLPSLQSNVNANVLEKQTLKVYSQLQNMIERYKVDNGTDRLDADFASYSNINKYMKVTAGCERAADCFASTYNTVRGGDKSFSINDLAKTTRCYQLQDGTSIGIAPNLMVFFDVNGKKKPNKMGYDMWILSIKSDTAYITDPDTSKETAKSSIATRLSSCLNGNSKYGCFGHFIRNGFKFDY